MIDVLEPVWTISNVHFNINLLRKSLEFEIKKLYFKATSKFEIPQSTFKGQKKPMLNVL